MSSPYPTRQEEAYTAYWENNEDYLLAEFLAANPGYPQVKDWGKWEQEEFEDYVQAAFESQGPDGDGPDD